MKTEWRCRSTIWDGIFLAKWMYLWILILFVNKNCFIKKMLFCCIYCIRVVNVLFNLFVLAVQGLTQPKVSESFWLPNTRFLTKWHPVELCKIFCFCWVQGNISLMQDISEKMSTLCVAISIKRVGMNKDYASGIIILENWVMDL